jgi:lysophospholipase L1-like esterase
MQNQFFPHRIISFLIIFCLSLTASVFAAAPIRICPMGDSITAGYTDNPTWTVPFEFGYRSGLYELLTNSGVPFQFVGESEEPWNSLSGTVTNTPAPDLRVVDQDYHDGYAWQGTAFILLYLNYFLEAGQPDVILLMIGINDIPEGSTAEPTAAELNLSNIVETVVSTNPSTYLIVAQITPFSSYTAATTKYNNYIRDVLVPYFAAQGKLVSTVNQYASLCVPGTTNIDASLYANGINHPSADGYNSMAQTWFAGIQALGLLPPPALVITKMADNTIQITWPQGVLLEATNISGPWITNSMVTSPFTISPTAQQMYFTCGTP